MQSTAVARVPVPNQRPEVPAGTVLTLRAGEWWHKEWVKVPVTICVRCVLWGHAERHAETVLVDGEMLDGNGRVLTTMQVRVLVAALRREHAAAINDGFVRHAGCVARLNGRHGFLPSAIP
jgi:hypothetical protein